MSRTIKNFAAAIACLVASAFAHSASAITVSTFTDVSQIDLSGTFIVADDIGGAGATVSGVPFTGGVYFGAPNFTHNWGGAVNINGGVGANADLNTILRTITYSGDAGPTDASFGPQTASIAVANGQYKVQLLLWENDSSRLDWNLNIEGDTQSNFDTLDYMTNGDAGTGVLVSSIVNVTDGFLNISVASIVSDADDGGPFPTNSTALNAFTVESVPEPGSASLLLLGCCALLSARKVSKRRGGR